MRLSSVIENKSKKDVIEHRQVAIKKRFLQLRKQKKNAGGMLKRRKKLSFFDVFDVHATRMELAVTFLALLELWHEKVVKVRQKSFLNDIKLEYTEIQEMRN
jgi:segregation and condensation protein A